MVSSHQNQEQKQWANMKENLWMAVPYFFISKSKLLQSIVTCNNTRIVYNMMYMLLCTGLL